MVAALACAARMGILIKNIGDIELAGSLTAIAFDKTGTLTTGELAVKRLVPAGNVSAEELLRIAGSVERYSNHPMAKAIVQVAMEAELEFAECKDFKEVAGRGVTAVVEGEAILIGRERWLTEQGVDPGLIESSGMEGLSTLFVAKGGKCVGCIGLEDKTRAEARNAVRELKALGIRQLMMFTGDKQPVAKKLSDELGCTQFEAECLPERKLELVRDMQERGHRVAVVGDGVNDAPALAAGDIGVAMGAAGSDVAINSATIALMSSDLNRLPFLIKLSRRAMRLVYQNLFFALLCIIGGLILSGLGILTPIIAAIFYLTASLIVVFNSARLVGYTEA
jgi:Cd2+/Zn2+-exporting ATPase